MTQRRPRIVVLAADDTGAGPFDLDYRNDVLEVRSICGTVVSGDTVTISVSPVPSAGKTILVKTTPSTVDAEDHVGFFTEVGAYTEDFSDVITGPFCQIKIVKTGTNGISNVYILG